MSTTNKPNTVNKAEPLGFKKILLNQGQISLLRGVNELVAWSQDNQEKIAWHGATQQTMDSYNSSKCELGQKEVVGPDGKKETVPRCPKQAILDEQDGGLPAYYVCPGCSNLYAYCCLIKMAREAALHSTEKEPWQQRICGEEKECAYTGVQANGPVPHSVDVQVRLSALTGLSERAMNEVMETITTAEDAAKAKVEQDIELSRKEKLAREKARYHTIRKRVLDKTGFSLGKRERDVTELLNGPKENVESKAATGPATKRAKKA